MYLKGTVEGIIFYNEQNGYTVMVVSSDDKDVTCVGNMPLVTVGEIVELEGKLISHSKYGEQFSVESISITAPKNKEGIIKYLSSGLIKGIGEITAKKIYEMFGDESMDVIENEPGRLAEIKGITKNKALEMGNCFSESKKMQAQIMFLQEYGVTISTAIKIYNVYKEATRQVVKENPYKLIDDVDGIGFVSADKIARKMGITEDSPFRIRASIVYCLKETAEKEGNTYLTFDDLKNRSAKALRLDLFELTDTYEDIISRLMLDVMIKDFVLNDIRCIALTKYYNIEKSIAGLLIKIQHEALPINEDFSLLVKEFERINNIKFHSSQVEAVMSAVNNGVTVITGGPGTGKTTIIKCIAYIFDTKGLRVEFCTPTGRASKRLSQSVNSEAKTIHRLLGLNYVSGQVNFMFNQYNQLNADVIVVDELSMVDVTIMNSLLKAIRAGARLILVGDKDQLPSVGAGNVLADIIKSGLIDVKYLTHIYRQSEDSLIISNAHLINEGKMPIISNSSKDFFVVDVNNNEQMLSNVVQLVSTRLPNYSKLDASNIQVLGPLKSNVSGVENCNKELQNKLNPKSFNKKEITFGDTVFRVNDKVMQTVNDYQLVWTKIGEYGVIEEGEGVFNGDIGVVTSIDSVDGFVEVLFDDNRTAQYTKLDLVNLQLAYAITIHKSQGSEFDIVVIPLTSGPPTILNKNLLYTAVTRAKKMVVLVCSRKVLAMTVHNNYIAMRLTLLQDFLKEENEKYERLLFE